MRKIALIGGDCRQIHAAVTLKQAGFCPFFYGNDRAANHGFTAPYTIQETLAGAEVLLLPVPTTKKEGCLHAPLFEKSIPLSLLADGVPRDCTVFLWGQEKSGMFAKHRIVDLSKDPICVGQNARATAEAALTVAMTHSQKAFFTAKCAVVGYGRIAGHLCANLLALGAEVRVGARREESRKSAQALGCAVFSPDDPRLFSGVDLVFNTVPEPILSQKQWKELSKEAVFVELASEPGGLAGQSHPFSVVKAPSLPGRCCPKSAGQFLGQAVLRHLMSEKEAAPW